MHKSLVQIIWINPKFWQTNKHCEASAVLQTPSSLIQSVSPWAFSSQSSWYHKSQTTKARELKFWEIVHPPQHVTCHVSCVTCQVSHVTCHLSHVPCQTSCVKFHFFFSLFSKHRPSGPMLSISRLVRPSVRVSVCRLSVHFWGTV